MRLWGIKKATAFLARHSPGYLAQCEWKAASSCAAKLCCVPAQHGSRSFVPALRFRRLSAHRAAFPASPRSAGRRVARSRSIPSMRVVRRRWRPHGPPATSPVRVRVRVRVVRVRVSFPAKPCGWLTCRMISSTSRFFKSRVVNEPTMSSNSVSLVKTTLSTVIAW